MLPFSRDRQPHNDSRVHLVFTSNIKTLPQSQWERCHQVQRNWAFLLWEVGGKEIPSPYVIRPKEQLQLVENETRYMGSGVGEKLKN